MLREDTGLNGMPLTQNPQVGQLPLGVGRASKAMMTVEHWPVLVPPAQHTT